MTAQNEAITIEASQGGKANIVISATNIDLFQLCEARFNYRVNLKKVLPIIQKSKSLDLGGLAHQGLEVYYNMLKEEKHYNDRVHAALMKMRESSSNVETSNSDETEVAYLLSVIEQNLDYWRSEDEQLRILSVEAPFDYILYEDDSVRIIISGKIDLLVDILGLGRNSGYENIPFDHKTYSRDFPTYRLSNQFSNYCVATGSNYLIVNKIGLQKTLKAEEKFKRIPLSYDPIILQEWKDNIIKMILGRYLHCVAENEWVMNFTSCFKFNRLCEYHAVCDSSGEDAKNFKLEANYINSKPWNKYKESEE